MTLTLNHNILYSMPIIFSPSLLIIIFIFWILCIFILHVYFNLVYIFYQMIIFTLILPASTSQVTLNCTWSKFNSFHLTFTDSTHFLLILLRRENSNFVYCMCISCERSIFERIMRNAYIKTTLLFNKYITFKV